MIAENMGFSLGGRSPPRPTPSIKQGVYLYEKLYQKNSYEPYSHNELQDRLAEFYISWRQ